MKNTCPLQRDWSTDFVRNCLLTFAHSLPVQCAYAGKPNCPQPNNFYDQIAQKRAPSVSWLY